jgi:MFS family permease
MSVLGTKRADAPRPHIRFIDVLRDPQFAVLYAAEMLSLAGDQLARIALSVLVFNSTGSASITAATYAATFLPAILGGYLLARVGDHLPRRAVMAGCDALRAACFGSMAIPGLPIIVVIALLVVAVFIGPAFTASEVSYLAGHFSPARFGVANVLRMSSSQVAQVAGFAVGGVLVELLGARGALAVNAVTFAVSAIVIGTSLRGRTAAQRVAAPSPSGGLDEPAPFGGLWRDAQLRSLISLTLLIGFFVVPEGLAVPYGRSMHASTIEVGVLLASSAFGGAVGAALLVRVPLDRRSSVAQWMAVACGLPLGASAVTHHLSLAILCWLASGIFAAYVVHVVTVVVQRIPDGRRSHLVGIVAALLLGAQGAGLLVFGAVTRLVSPGGAIGTAGLVGSACALVLVVGPLRRAQPSIAGSGGAQVSG